MKTGFLHKKPVQAAAALAVATGIALTGAFAWNSFNQSRINVFHDLILPNVNLHDDFEGGPNKDIYVENSGQANIYVRVRLTEFLQTENRGSLVEGQVRDDDKAYLWAPHNATDKIENCVLTAPNTTSAEWNGDNFHDYYTWTMGSQNEANPTAQIYYKPATQEQKGEYDENGNVLRDPQVVSDPLTGTSAAGDASVDYAALVAAKIAELKAATPDLPEDDAEQAALAELGLKKTQTASVITMTEWKTGTTGIAEDAPGYRAPYAQGDFWVIDESDGWAYWASALPGGSATGLLLDKVTRTDKPFDSNAEYAINAWLQAVTEDDLGQFAANGGGISANGLKLLQLATGGYVRDAQGVTYTKNKDGTYTASQAADGTELTGQTAFVPLGAAPGDEANTPEENRLQIGQRLIFDPAPEWGDTAYTNWADLTAAAGPWYNLKPTGIADKALDNGKPIYELTGTRVWDGVTYLTLTAVEENGAGGAEATGRTLAVTSIRETNGGYSAAAPGHGPFAPVWAGADGRLGSDDDVRQDPVIAIGAVSFSHIGNGVYVEAASEVQGKARAAADNPTYYFAGRLISSAALANAKGNTAEEKIASAFPLILAVGDAFSPTFGEYDGKVMPVTGYTKTDGGAYTMPQLTLGADGNYYISLGDEKQGYIAPGADGFLGGGTVSDVRVWPGEGGIGGGNDRLTYYLEPFLAGKTSDDLQLNKTFGADGKTWVVLAIDEYGNRLIMSQSFDVFSPFGASNVYNGSALQTAMKEFTDSKIPTLKPYVMDAATPVETGTWSAEMPVQESALSSAMATQKAPTAFPLSQSEYSKYNIANKTPSYGDKKWCWTRTSGSTDYVAIFFKTSAVTNKFTENTFSAKAETLPAMWVRFSDADQMATANQEQLAAWKNMPAVGSTVEFGSYPQDQAADTPVQPIEWTVLTTQGAKALLLSAKTLANGTLIGDGGTTEGEDTGKGDPILYTQWETAPTRAFLNGDFLNTAFNSAEQAKIQTTTVITAGMETTQDKVFIPSYEELTVIYPANLLSPNTVYAMTGMFQSWNNWYWLRSTNNAGAAFILRNLYGRADNGSGNFRLGLRPMIWVDYSK